MAQNPEMFCNCKFTAYTLCKQNIDFFQKNIFWLAVGWHDLSVESCKKSHVSISWGACQGVHVQSHAIPKMTCRKHVQNGLDFHFNGWMVTFKLGWKV